MRALHARRPVARLPRPVLAGLVTAVALALVACGAGEPVSPATGADGEVSAAPSTDAAESAVGALTISPRIAFSSYRIGDHPDIYRMDPSGTNVTRAHQLYRRRSLGGDVVGP